jgi:hypothetical protein
MRATTKKKLRRLFRRKKRRRAGQAMRRRQRRSTAHKVAAVCLLLLLLASDVLVMEIVGRKDGVRDTEVLPAVEGATEAELRMIENAAAQAALNQSFAQRVQAQAVEMLSADGLLLAGQYYENAGSHKWAIVIHGYRGAGANMVGYAQRYYDAGYQVLAPDLRASGNSEGDYLGMGWLDKEDMLRWVGWICARDPDAQIVLHGVSMGAATAMMTAGLDTPAAVRAFVEDSGYTSVWELFRYAMWENWHLPTFPLLHTANGLVYLRAGYEFRTASALRQVKKCEKPMLFIHGDRDTFVPFAMLKRLYDAKPGTNKKMLVAEGAGHGQAALTLGEAYWQAVFDFLAENGL